MEMPKSRAITLALALSTASTGPQLLALGLLMPEISLTLNTPIPLLGQFNTVFSVVAIFLSLVMGVLTIKYPPKKLLQTGIICLLIGVIIASLSQNYLTMFISFIFYGFGNGFALPIINLLVALFPPSQRTSTMGRIYSGRSLTSIFATPVIGFLAILYGWRVGYFGFGAPLILFTLIMVYIAVPEQPQKKEKKELTCGFKKILMNKSALACIIGASLALAFLMSFMVYNGTYLRNTLGLSLQTASLVMSSAFIAVAVGQVISGKIVARLGVKKTTYLATFFCGVSLLVYFSFPLPLSLSLLASFIGTAAAGTTMTTMTTLALDQIPDSRGTMMSLNSAAMQVSSMIGSSIGGPAISSFGFSGYGQVMFIISLTTTIIFYKWTEENKHIHPLAG
jgi:predicted MFS family arabinose efflux permease